MTLREKILTEFQDWNSDKQLQEFQAYKQLEGHSPLSDTDYNLMEQIINNSNASIDCEDGKCEISYENPDPAAPIVKPIEEPSELEETIIPTEDSMEAMDEAYNVESGTTKALLENETDESVIMVEISNLVSKIVEHRMSTDLVLDETAKSDKLAKGINKKMIKIDDSMSVTDFALAVAKILSDQYGSHNIEPFISTLKKNLED